MNFCSYWFLEILHLSLPLCIPFEEFGYSFCIHYLAYLTSSPIPDCFPPFLALKYLLFLLIFSTSNIPMSFLPSIVQPEARCFPIADGLNFPCFLSQPKESSLALIQLFLSKQQNGELIKSGKNLWKPDSLYKLLLF